MTQYTNGLKLEPTTISTGSLNDVTENKFALYSSAVSNLPVSLYCFVRTSVMSNTNMLQEAFVISNARTFVRTKQTGTWSGWIEITNSITKDTVTFTPSAENTYEYTTITFSVAPGDYVRFSARQNWSTGAPTGLILSTSSTVSGINAANTEAITEQDGASPSTTALHLNVFINNSGTSYATYYLYAKKLKANQSNKIGYVVERLY